MLKEQNIICISSIDWDFIWQGHQEIMSAFAKNGNRVLFIENTGVRKPTIKDIGRLKKRVVSWLKSVKGFRKESDNLFVYSPVVLPFPYSKIASWINRRLLIEPLKRWLKAMSFRDPIIWTFLPTSIALDIINEVDYRKLLVYYDIADFDTLTDNPKKLKAAEEELVKKCDVVFAQGKAIADKCRQFNNNVHIFPFGVNTKVFEDFLNNPLLSGADDIDKIKKPIIGYVGGIHKHVDIPLINYMAESHPEWSIVLVGPKQVDTASLDRMPNIFTLGKKEFDKLPAYISQFDVCTIPYLISDYTRTVYPTKLNEYYMMGKPVVSTALPEVEAINEENGNITAIARTHEEFVKLVENALLQDSLHASTHRAAVAKDNCWAARIARMSALMEEAIALKELSPSANWQERFLQLYKKTKHGVIKIVAAVVAVYLLIFYTPIVWVLAQPLVISDQLKRANAIVVLGGGVGESGKAGQGYEERAQYAVELYKKGYADHIVFSSGYSYIFDETLVMKALAVSMSVPEKAIVLETGVSNTHDSVLSAKKIADNNRWKTIILLSSPYHMMRVSMVFKKLGGGIDVIYSPTPKSSFYEHANRGFFGKKISIQQIRGIIHEYTGIIYYWWKGWV